MTEKRIRNQKATKPVRKFLHDRRALGVALTTMMITAGVVAAGIAVMYWTYSWGNIANDEYSKNISNSQDFMGERLAFEFTTYSSVSRQLTINVINCGMTNNVSIARVYVWGSSSQLTGTFTPDAPGLMNITSGAAIPGNKLNKGEDGYFKITFSQPLSLEYYTFRVVTERWRNFDGSFFAS